MLMGEYQYDPCGTPLSTPINRHKGYLSALSQALLQAPVIKEQTEQGTLFRGRRHVCCLFGRASRNFAYSSLAAGNPDVRLEATGAPEDKGSGNRQYVRQLSTVVNYVPRCRRFIHMECTCSLHMKKITTHSQNIQTWG